MTTPILLRAGKAPPRSVRIDAPLGWRARIGECLALFSLLLYRYRGQETISFEMQEDEDESGLKSAPARRSIEIDFTCDPGFRAIAAECGNAARRPFDSLNRLTCFAPGDLCRILSDSSGDPQEGTLDFNFENANGQSQLNIGYTAGVYEERTILTLARHCERLVASALASPDLPASQLEMMTSEELRHILVERNGSTIEFERQTIPQAFEEQVARTPDAPALIYRGQTMSYRQLQARASEAAGSLQAAGVVPETLVGVYLDDPLAIAIAYFGILIAGGAPAALDPEWPRERLEQVLAEAAVPFVIASSALALSFPPGSHVMLTQDVLEASPQSAPLHPTSLTPQNAAYVVFTSGSTGIPKGVVGLHRTITSMPKMTRPLRPDEVFALSANLTFGAGVVGLFFPLIQGAAVFLVPRDMAQDLSALVQAWKAGEVTRITLVPPQLRQLTLLGKAAAEQLKNITTIALAGAALTPELLPLVYQLFPQAAVINAYTCIEAGTMITRWEATPADRARPLTVGSVLPNIRVYILGPKLNPLPAGMPGEIYVGSADLSRGYLNRPEWTRERFLPNPFDPSGVTRIYRTGDIGRLLFNGELEYLGRADNQVKIRGIRIELEEIEAALQIHGGVHQAAVTANSRTGESSLVAFVSPKPGATLSTSELRRSLQGLPQYMVPGLFVIMDSLPMTGNGKIDRRRLPPVDASRPEIDTEYVAPRDEDESSMLAIWEQELSIRGIGVNDHFLEVGGDSLIAVRIATRLQGEFGGECPVASLFEYPTVRGLAEFLRPPMAVSQRGLSRGA